MKPEKLLSPILTRRQNRLIKEDEFRIEIVFFSRVTSTGDGHLPVGNNSSYGPSMIHDDPANDDFTVGNGDFRYVKAVKLQMGILGIVTFPSWDVRPKFHWGVQLSLGMVEIFFGLCLGFGW